MQRSGRVAELQSQIRLFSPGSVSATCARRSRTGGCGYSRMLSFTQRIRYFNSLYCATEGSCEDPSTRSTSSCACSGTSAAMSHA